MFLVLNRINDFIYQLPKYKLTLLAEAIWQIYDGQVSSSKFGQSAGKTEWQFMQPVTALVWYVIYHLFVCGVFGGCFFFFNI